MMTVHVLHAGDGYTYLTRQVASGDEVRARGEGLTDYYAASGNPPGRWVGQGCAALEVEGVVDEAQMKALFGEGRHPRTDEIVAEIVAAGGSVDEALEATRLGRKMPTFANEKDNFDRWVESAFDRFEKQHGRRPEPGVEADLVRYDVATKYIAKESPGVVVDDVAVRKFFAERGGKNRQPVSGYDLVFTPSKSVSVLWGIADRDTARVIERAHETAWRRALSWLEEEAALTRMGAGGLSQINADGFVATAFDHIDSRAGDPNLHTHVAVANRVKGVDGKWRALDARALHHFAVAASERYNLYVEQELTQNLGVQFEDVFTRRGGQPVREIHGVPKALRDAFAQRSQAITGSLERLVNDYKAKHGVMPSKATQLRLAQEATLATREGKEVGVTLLERRAQWRQRAAEILGGTAAVEAVVSRSLHGPAVQAPPTMIDVDVAAVTVVENLSLKRSRWNRAHVAAEATRVIRATAAGGVLQEGVLEAVTEAACNRYSVSLEAPETLARPAALSRQDGSSVFRAHGAQWRTSIAVLDREDRLLAAARVAHGPVFDAGNVALVSSMSHRPLDDGQLAVAQRFASSGRLLDAAIGPAGTGKTTAMRAFARGVEMGGGRVIALAPSAAAAKVLGDELEVRAETVAKFLLTQEGLVKADAERADAMRRLRATGAMVDSSQWAPAPHALRMDESTIVLVDEAGMTDAGDIDRIVAQAREAGASVRLIGDPAQLDAVTGAGALRMLDREVGTGRLSEVHRFADAQERDTTLAIRDGNVKAAEFYIDNGRLIGGTHAEILDRVYEAWSADNAAGLDSVMIAHSNDDVATLARRAQADRVASGDVTLTDIGLHNGSLLGVGDHIVTRRNDRTNTTASGDFVKNGDVWTVQAVDHHGLAHVLHTETNETVTLSREYLANHVELAYAGTIHRVQGRTVDHAHALITDATTREQLYVALTRGRHGNFVYAATETHVEADAHSPVPDSDAPAAILRRAIAREGAELSARETFQREIEAHESLDTMLGQYEHVLGLHPGAIDHDHVRDVLRRAYGGASHYVIDDSDAWLSVARKVDALEQTGMDPVRRLAGVVRVEELASDGSAGRLVVERLGEIGPGRRVSVAEINPWLEGMEDRIRARLATNEFVDLPRGRDLDAVRRAWGVAPPAADAPRVDEGTQRGTLAARAAALRQARAGEVDATVNAAPAERAKRLAQERSASATMGAGRHILDAARAIDRDGPEM